MGLTVSIFRDDYDSSLNVFHGYKELTIVNLDGPSEPRAGAPAALLVDGNLPGILKVVAAEKVGDAWLPVAPSDQVGPMFGGTFAHNSDTRFASATKWCGAIAIHDRFESVADYQTYST